QERRVGAGDQQIDRRVIEAAQDPFGRRDRPQIIGSRQAEHGDQADHVNHDRRDLDAFRSDRHHDDRDGADQSQGDAGGVHDAVGDDLDAVVGPADLAALARDRRGLIRLLLVGCVLGHRMFQRVWRRPYSGLMPEALITFAHLSASAAICWANSAGEFGGIGRGTSSGGRGFIVGSGGAPLEGLFMVASSRGARVFRAPQAIHGVPSLPGRKRAGTGRSGSTSRRVVVLTASGRSLPDLMCGTDDGVTSNITCTCPASRSVSAGVEPRYGTCTRLTPAMNLNSSPATCCGPPMPAEAMLILPGLALAYAMNSGTVFAGNDGL